MNHDVTAETLPKSVSCVQVKNYDWMNVHGSPRTCWMRDNTSIDSIGFKISSQADDTMKGITFFTNKKIAYLPEDVDSVYPNLLVYGASKASSINSLMSPQDLIFYEKSKLCVKSS